jgi:hypothetical protein
VNGGSTKDLEAIVARAATQRYSEQEMVADEGEINGREDIKAQLKAGIADPSEELKAKAALITPWSWPEEQKLNAAKALQTRGNLDSVVQDALNGPRPPTKREMQGMFDPSRYANLEWKTLPPGVATPMTAEIKAELAAREADATSLKAQYDAETAANPEFYKPKSESNAMYATNVATLPDSEIQPRIEYFSYLIQSGEADKYSFQSGNGDQTTTSIHQYLSWLQQRAQDLDSDGTYSPAMFK